MVLDAALKRCNRTHSTLTVVLLSWSRARKGYERRGLPVDAEALARAERVLDGASEEADGGRSGALVELGLDEGHECLMEGNLVRHRVPLPVANGTTI